MTLQTSLLALVLLVLCGGLASAWAEVPASAPIESPAAPDAPPGGEAEAEEAVFETSVGDRPETDRRLSRNGVGAGSVETSVGTPPPER
ncbi:hypothetical protein [Rubrivirga sp.]|uniref:hypothetical protein n=1 Tax=Rubrivirga sp. TaxID=1885344 RepID=UPI003B51C854